MFITSPNFDLFKKRTYKANVLLILSGREGNIRVVITINQTIFTFFNDIALRSLCHDRTQANSLL